MKRTRSLIVLLLLLAVAPTAMAKEPLRLRSRTLAECGLRISPRLEMQVERITPRLQDGIRRMVTLFENPSLPRPHTFWLLLSKNELETVLQSSFFRLSEEEITGVKRVNHYRAQTDSVIMVHPNISDEDLLRLLYTEYSRTMLEASINSEESSRVNWFYNGMSAHLAWLINGEQKGEREKDIIPQIKQYYGNFLVPEHIVPLSKLETTDDWRTSLKAAPSSIYSLAVISYLYLAGKHGRRIGIEIIRIYAKEHSFKSAFRRATGVDLAEYEKDLEQNFIAPIVEERKKMLSEEEREDEEEN